MPATMGAIAASLIGGVASAILGNAMGGDSAPAPATAAPEVKPPTPIPLTPEQDPRQKAQAERSILMGANNDPKMNSSNTILGSGTLG